MRSYSQKAHLLHHHRKGKQLRTNIIFEQNSKVHFTAVRVNFAIIYELFIWDKSIVPDWLFNTNLAVGLVGVLLILPIVICGYKHRMD